MAQSVGIVGISEYFAQTGTVAATTADLDDYCRQVYSSINRLLNGEDPKNINDTYPEKINYFLNITIAKRKNININDLAIKNAKKIYGQ